MNKNELIISDNDFLTCFLEIEEESILKKIFTKILVPDFVQYEIYNPNTPQIIQTKFNKLIDEKFIEIIPINYGTTAYDNYNKIKDEYRKNRNKEMGDGEAGVIALALMDNYTVASNNLRDVKKYIKYYNLSLITTSFILARSYEHNLLSKKEVDKIWDDLYKKGKYLPNVTFENYINFTFEDDKKLMKWDIV